MRFVGNTIYLQATPDVADVGPVSTWYMYKRPSTCCCPLHGTTLNPIYHTWTNILGWKHIFAPGKFTPFWFSHRRLLFTGEIGADGGQTRPIMLLGRPHWPKTKTFSDVRTWQQSTWSQLASDWISHETITFYADMIGTSIYRPISPCIDTLRAQCPLRECPKKFKYEVQVGLEIEPLVRRSQGRIPEPETMV